MRKHGNSTDSVFLDGFPGYFGDDLLSPVSPAPAAPNMEAMIAMPVAEPRAAAPPAPNTAPAPAATKGAASPPVTPGKRKTCTEGGNKRKKGVS